MNSKKYLSVALLSVTGALAGCSNSTDATDDDSAASSHRVLLDQESFHCEVTSGDAQGIAVVSRTLRHDTFQGRREITTIAAFSEEIFDRAESVLGDFACKSPDANPGSTAFPPDTVHVLGWDPDFDKHNASLTALPSDVDFQTQDTHDWSRCASNSWEADAERGNDATRVVTLKGNVEEGLDLRFTIATGGKKVTVSGTCEKDAHAITIGNTFPK